MFAIQLAATVTAQYPLSDAMGVARNIFKRLDRLVIEVPSVQQDKVFKPVLPAVVTFCETFPPLFTAPLQSLFIKSKFWDWHRIQFELI